MRMDKEINKLIQTPIPVIEDHPFKSGETDIPIMKPSFKKSGSSKKSGSFRFSKDAKKRWDRKPRNKKSKSSNRNNLSA